MFWGVNTSGSVSIKAEMVRVILDGLVGIWAVGMALGKSYMSENIRYRKLKILEIGWEV